MVQTPQLFHTKVILGVRFVRQRGTTRTHRVYLLLLRTIFLRTVSDRVHAAPLVRYPESKRVERKGNIKGV